MIPWWGSQQTSDPQRSIQDTLDLIARLFSTATRSLAMASAQIEALRAQVEATKGTMESAALLLAGLHTRLDEAGVDPVALDAIKDDLKTQTDALAAAVAANA